jgi:DNA-binding XRE family transcriptional regulator
LPQGILQVLLIFHIVKKSKYVRKQEELEAFGRHLRHLREQKGMTMEELAALSNIEYSQISRIERGVINTSLSVVFIIAEVLGVSYKDMFDFKK